MKNKEFEKMAMDYLRKSMIVLGMQNFHPVQLEYKNDPKETASIEFAYPYMSVKIYYGDEMLQYFKEKKLHLIKDVLAHELCHMITDPLYSKAYDRFISKSELNDERERLTDYIANLLRINKVI